LIGKAKDTGVSPRTVVRASRVASASRSASRRGYPDDAPMHATHSSRVIAEFRASLFRLRQSAAPGLRPFAEVVVPDGRTVVVDRVGEAGAHHVRIIGRVRGTSDHVIAGIPVAAFTWTASLRAENYCDEVTGFRGSKA
jgi:hypothetical protein